MSRPHPVFNVVKLIPAPEDPIPNRRAEPPPPPELVDGEEHYVVEKVLDSRLMRGRLHFLVKWEGYGYEENTWVAEEDMAAPAKVQEFYQLHPGAPRRILSMAFDSLVSHVSRTQHSREGGDVRGQPIPNTEPRPNSPTQTPISQPKSSTRNFGIFSTSSETSGWPKACPQTIRVRSGMREWRTEDQGRRQAEARGDLRQVCPALDRQLVAHLSAEQ